MFTQAESEQRALVVIDPALIHTPPASRRQSLIRYLELATSAGAVHNSG